jgi:hypothetical protein
MSDSAGVVIHRTLFGKLDFWICCMLDDYRYAGNAHTPEGKNSMKAIIEHQSIPGGPDVDWGCAKSD